jgi:hypothetical protein
MIQVVIYMFLITGSQPVVHVGTFVDMPTCQNAASQATAPKAQGATQSWQLLCMAVNSQGMSPPRINGY